MRILMIAPTPFFAHRGCHVRILEETRALQTLGHQVTICTYHGGEDVAGLDIRRIPPSPWYGKDSVGPSRHRYYMDMLLFLHVTAFGLRERVDVIHAHLHEGALIGYPLAQMLNIPLVFDCQGSLVVEMLEHGYLRENGLGCRAFRHLERFIHTLPDFTVTSAPSITDMLVSSLSLSPETVCTVDDGVNTQEFRRQATGDLRAQLRIPMDRRVVVYLGLLRPCQGIDYLLEAIPRVIASVPNAHFLIMGYPFDQHYRRKAQELGFGDHVTFPGRINYFQASQYLSLGELAVSPKFSQTESNGKLYNYMGVGLPSVVFDLPVNRDVLGDLGIYARTGDPLSLAQQIIRVLEHPAWAAGLGQALRQRATGFGWEHAGERLVQVYQAAQARRAHQVGPTVPEGLRTPQALLAGDHGYKDVRPR